MIAARPRFRGSPLPGRAVRRSSIAVVLVVIAACGATVPTPPAVTPGTAVASDTPASPAASSAAPVASPSLPAPTAGASPSPAGDITDATLRLIADHGFTTRSTVAGSLRIGSSTSKLGGTYDITTNGFSRAIKVAQGAEQRFVVEDAQARSGVGGQPWFAADVPHPPADLATTLAAIESLSDLGIESKGGRSLHHLVASNAKLSPAALGLEPPTVAPSSGTVDLWVSDDGVPAWIAASTTWLHGSGKAKAAGSMSVEFTLSDVGDQTIIVNVPQPAWYVQVGSRYRYQIGRPYTWTFTPGTGKYRDELSTFSGAPQLLVYSASAQGYSLADWISSIKRSHPSGVTKFVLGSSKATKLAGEPARLLEYRQTYQGRQEWDIEIFAIHRGRLYSVDWTLDSPLTANDRLLLDQFLSTFAYR